MYQKIEECPLCQSGHFGNYLICKDHSVSGESFAIVQCQNCNLRFTNPRPTPDSIVTYYLSESYISIANKTTGITDFIYKLARIFTLGWKVRLISSVANIGTVLDVGCGTGHFLKACQRKGWEVVGVEPSPAQNQAEKLTGGTIYSELKDLPPQNKYQIITLWHVLEHIPDLNETMTHFRKILGDNGRLIIAVPNGASWDAANYQEFWAGYDVPRHLFHFTPETMKQLCSANKLRIEDTYPLKLDSFYVSLLSEKYRNLGMRRNILALFSTAFFNGLKSNSWARRNGNNYSSLIYVIGKK